MRLNPHLAAMPGGYLFAEIARRVQAYEPRAPRPIIRLGIGDVTRPLPAAVTGFQVPKGVPLRSEFSFFATRRK